MFRLLLVEDNPERVDRFRRWIPDSVRLAHVRSAGVALGLIRRDSGREFGGILLDHDLQEQVISQNDTELSGSNVTGLLVERAGEWADVPVLIHSTNRFRSAQMARRLESAGFWVEAVPMDELTHDRFNEWLGEAMADLESR